VNAAKNSARRSGEQFKQELEQYRMSSAEFIRSMRELELGTLSTERKAVSRSQVTDPKDRIAKDSRLKEIDAEIADVGRKYGRMAEDFAAKREATQIKMDAELGKLSSPNERAYASLLKDYGEELKRAIADGDWITVDKWKKMLGMREATEAFGDLSKSFEAEIKRMEASLTGNQIGVALGSLTQESADFAERGIRSSAVAALRQLRDQMVTTAGDSKVLKDALADIEAKLQGAAKGMAEAPPTTFWEAANAGAKDYLQSIGTVAKQQEQMFTKAFQGMEDALVSFVKTGKLDFKSLADSIITDLIRMQVRAAMEPVTQGLTGWLQGLWSSHPADIGADAYSGDAGLAAAASIGGAHEGAIAGMEATFSRSVPLSLFSGASRYHTGGILPGEVPIIARRGEGIFTPEQMRALAPVGQAQSVQGGNVTVNVVNNAAGTQATAKERTDGGGNRFVDVFIEQIKGAIASDITRGSGAVPSAIQGTYGLNRTAGAY
jgi:lambda family phage tail tape measure protein